MLQFLVRLFAGLRAMLTARPKSTAGGTAAILAAAAIKRTVGRLVKGMERMERRT